VHDETRCFEDPRHDKFGITVLAVPERWDDAHIEKRLRALVTARKYVQRAHSWTGLAVRADAPDAVHTLVQIDEHWEPDQTLGALVAELGMRPAAEVGIELTAG
jgi:hypothetical protein